MKGTEKISKRNTLGKQWHFGFEKLTISKQKQPFYLQKMFASEVLILHELLLRPIVEVVTIVVGAIVVGLMMGP